MLKLVSPNISHKEQWEEIMAEWNDGEKRPTIFFQDSFDIFLDKMEKVKNHDEVENQIPKSRLYFLLEYTGKIVGFFWFRYHMNFHDDAKYSGNIGYGIRPSERNRGHAKDGLKLLLKEIQKIGYTEVMIACHDDNTPSYKVIEANGGILHEKVVPPDGKIRRRYKIEFFKEEIALLQSLERELLSFECRHNTTRINELLSDDFFECGKTGKMFGKNECLESLPNESRDKKFDVRDMSVHMLSENLGQVRYICTIGNPGDPPTTSFRTSLWKKTESGWQMFYHQGTLIQ